MDVNLALALLGGLTPAAFMRRHWQKKPLLVRQAWPGVQPPLSRSALFDLGGLEDVESRLVCQQGAGWKVRSGPFPRRALPPLRQPGWTLLVQGLDLHVPAAHEMLARFRFVPDARLDDLMLSWASGGGGVGPHLDSYDVFLLQVQGRRRWRVGRVRDPAWQEGQPLKVLQRFEPEHEWLLEPGDMLYLPPRWGHEGVAVGGDCMTCSIGFRAPAAAPLAAELLQRIAEGAAEDAADQASTVYRDPMQPGSATPGAMPVALQEFARAAVRRLLARPGEIERALGEVFTEPKPRVWFEAGGHRALDAGVVLAAGTRMLYDDCHVFINGESFRASGRDARLMHALADQRALPGPACARLSATALSLLNDWYHDGWLVAGPASIVQEQA